MLCFALALPADALAKGLLEVEPFAPVARTPVMERGVDVDIRHLPRLEEEAKTKEEIALELGSQIGRLAESWADGASLPLLGGMVGGMVRMSRVAVFFGDQLNERYGVSIRHRDAGVAVMWRRRF